MNITNIPKLRILGTLSLLLILSVVSIAFLSTTRSSAQGRKYHVKTFKDMPVEVREVRNLQKGEEWFRDLEIEIKNISDKPIYFITLTIEFPDIPAPADAPEGSKIGYPLHFGNRKLGDLRQLAGPEDVSIKPGETYVFTITQGFSIGLENMKQKLNLPSEAVQNIVIEFNTISFGDGTGFEGSGFGGKRDYRVKISLNDKRDNRSNTCQALQASGLEQRLFRKISLKDSSAPLITNAQTSCGTCSKWRIGSMNGPYCAYGANCDYGETDLAYIDNAQLCSRIKKVFFLRLYPVL